jgi:hypothetical protein
VGTPSVTSTAGASTIAKTAVVLQSAIFTAQTEELVATSPDNRVTTASATLVALFSRVGTATTAA